MLLPHGVYEIERRRAARVAVHPDIAVLLKANTALKNGAAGRRCFILGNGPSAIELDLEQLAGEVVLSVSNGYLHRGFKTFTPAFHCVPQITYGLMTPEDVVSWFTEMHESIGDAELFLSTTEAHLVRKHQLFRGRVVRYMHLVRDFDELKKNEIIDIAQPVPRVESVPIMALMIAMYLGFNEIVLLGVDHDHFLTSKYQYAFGLTVQQGRDHTTDGLGGVTLSRHDDFQSLARLWRQYRCLSKIASAQGISIFNSTPGGALDEFERVPLEDWFLK
jgi:hypothetical protein